MPFYEYECAFCGGKVARLVSLDNRDDQYCECSVEGLNDDVVFGYHPRLHRLPHWGTVGVTGFVMGRLKEEKEKRKREGTFREGFYT